MRTKIVYVVVADSTSIYLEQAYISIWSLKQHNASAWVTMVMDNRTKEFFDASGYSELFALVDEVVVHSFDNNFSNMYRSRWLKTSLCNLVDGDFLFLDTDTVVLGNIEGIDEFTGSVGAVSDLHQPTLATCRYIDFIRIKMAQTNWEAFDYDEQTYYNSGVILVRNNSQAKAFFNQWHQNWLYSNSKGCSVDQISLNYTNKELRLITNIDEKYHCQILGNGLNYLRDALIIHYFNTSKHSQQGEMPFSLMEEAWFDDIKENKGISSELKEVISSERKMFSSQVDVISGAASKVYYSNLFKFIVRLNTKHPRLYKVLNKVIVYMRLV